MNQEIINYRDEKIPIYKDELELHSIIENDKTKAEDYAGREIFEFLQNAIDVGDKVKLELSGNNLIVSNTGEPFKTKNIKAIMIPNNSTKADSNNTIGCKGVGFRAALNISDNISIHSDEIHLLFSKENAEKMQAENGLKEAPPTMRCPSITNSIPANDYSTNIIIKIRDQEQVERIKSQLMELNKESILFFPDRFKRLEIVINGESNVFSRSRKIISDNEALITISHNGNLYQLREFSEEGTLNEYTGTDKRYRVSVIYSPEKISNNKLYSFFRTDIDFPMNHWFAHGTFNLINNRNHLVKNSKRNKILLEKLMRLMCNSAVKISDSPDYTGYKILKSHGLFSSSILENVDLNLMLENEIKNAPILPTIKHRFISINSSPVFYDLNLQKYLMDMSNNDNLLIYTNDTETVTFLAKDINYKYPLETVSRFLEKNIEKLSKLDRVICAKLLFRYYGDKPGFTHTAPNFFIDEDGQGIKNGSILIEPYSTDKLTLPDYMNFEYADNEQVEYAMDQTICTDKYTFIRSDFAKAYGIKMADTEEILRKNDEIIKSNPKLMPDYVRWLFDNRSIISKSSHENYYVLTKNNEIRRSDSTYFGKEYIEKTELEKFYEPSKIIAPPSTYKIHQDELENFTIFLKEDLKIADSPRKTNGSIDGLKLILEKASTEYIINLILDYKNYLDSNRIVNNTIALDLFQTSKWITKKGKRYAPNNVVLTSRRNYHRINDYIKDDFLFISQDELLPDIQSESGKVWLIKEYLCFKTELYELNNKYLYKILNELPVFDTRGEISEDVYKDIIIKNDEREKPSEHLPEFYSFINHGKVFCNDKKFHPIKECLYLEKKYPKVIESEHTFINIVKGKSADAIKERLGIDTLSVEYNLCESSKSNSNTTDFKDDLNNFKTALLAENNSHFNNEDSVKRLQKMNVVLCDKLAIMYDDKKGILNDYEFVKEDDDFYIKVPNKSFFELKKDDDFQDALSEIFKSKYSFLDEDGTARAIGRDINTRIERVKKEFGNNAWGDAEAKLELLQEDTKDYSSENLRILYNLRDKYFEPYSQILYSKLQNAKLDEKAQYVKQLKEYRNRIFNINDIPSQKNTNMLDYLKSEYDVENNNIVLIKDINKKRKDSYEILSKEFLEYNDILEQLFSDDYFESLLRFGELSPIRQEMLLLIEKTKIAKERSDKQTGDNPVSISTDEPVKQQPAKEKEPRHNDPTIAPKTVNPAGITLKTTHHFKHQPLIKKDGISVEFVPFDEVKKKTQVNNTTGSNQPTKHMTSCTKKEIEKRAKEAEKIALSELEKHGYTNIKWVSSFAKDEDKNLDGSDGYGYDILCEKDGNVRYVEVKSSIYSSGVEFEMTENELSTCSKNKDNYDIAYVYGMNSELPKLTIIENVFYVINDSNKTPASYKITLK